MPISEDTIIEIADIEIAENIEIAKNVLKGIKSNKSENELKRNIEDLKTINKKDYEKLNLLWYAALYNRPNICKLLIES